MIEKFIEKVGRRDFLSRMSAGAAALVCSILGISSQASGIVLFLCCGLCAEPAFPCQGGVCSWCWYCGPLQIEKHFCYKYKCIERYSVAGCNGQSCDNLVCSGVSLAGKVPCDSIVPDLPCSA